MEANMEKRMMDLIAKLNRASEAYYNGGESFMSDREWDTLYGELEKLEKKTGVRLPNSPTGTVGAPPLPQSPQITQAGIKGLRKVRHEKAALSLDKTKDPDVLASWLSGREGVLSWKMDGLTIVATYLEGKLALAATRGDGIIGEDITKNALEFYGLPKEIPFLGKLVIRGEAVISYSEFERINRQLLPGTEPYKNPRNLASATVRLLNGIEGRRVDVYAFELVEMATPVTKSNVRPSLMDEQFSLLAQYGFRPVPHRVVTPDSIKHDIAWYEEQIGISPFPSDGLVLAYRDRDYAESLGVTGKFPRGSIAFKWKDETAETKLTGIEWSPSATGLLNPVAMYEPVELEGTTISRASVHNISIMESLALGIGDRILVYKANMIIPQIAENLTRSDTLKSNLPKVCPVCGKSTVILTSKKDGREVKTLYCANPECPAKHLGMFSRFVSREGMNIVGLSDETLKKFIARGWLKTLSDIYQLHIYRDEIAKMDGFGEKSANNILEAIERSRNTEGYRFLYALGIPNVGTDAAKRIIRWCGGTVAGFIEKLRFCEDFAGIEGIGGVINNSIYCWKADKGKMEDFSRLIDVLEFQEEGRQDNASADTYSDVLKGKTVVITGSLHTFKNRDAFIAFVEANGGKVAGSVSKKTDYLVNNDVFSNSSKNRKAKELDIPILSEEEFKNIVLAR